jgi:hypothetical protein
LCSGRYGSRSSTVIPRQTASEPDLHRPEPGTGRGTTAEDQPTQLPRERSQHRTVVRRRDRDVVELHIRSIIAEPNSEVFTSLAPSMSRAKS